MAGQAVLLIKPPGETAWTTPGQEGMPYGAIIIPIADGQTALNAVAAYVGPLQFPLETEATFAELGTPSTYDMKAGWVVKP